MSEQHNHIIRPPTVIPRNPYEVLGIPPIFHAELRRKIAHSMAGIDPTRDALKSFGIDTTVAIEDRRVQALRDRIRSQSETEETADSAVADQGMPNGSENVEKETNNDMQEEEIFLPPKTAKKKWGFAKMEPEEAAEFDEAVRGRDAEKLLVPVVEVELRKQHLRHLQESLVTDREIDRLRAEYAEVARACMLRAAEIIAPDVHGDVDTPDDIDPKLLGPHVVSVAPDMSRLTVMLQEALLRLRSDALKRKKKKSREELGREIEQLIVRMRADERLYDISDLQPFSLLLRMRRYLSEVLPLEEELLAFNDKMYARKRELSELYHPDRNPGSRLAEHRFKEVMSAVETLENADEEERLKLAYELVFNMDISGWSKEMLQIAFPIVQEFAPFFAKARPLAMDAEPCKTCHGRGAVRMQRQRDYFPVPADCVDCNAYGDLPSFTQELRRTLEALPRRVPAGRGSRRR